MYQRYRLKRRVNQLELDLIRLKVDMEQEGSWESIWRRSYNALRLLPDDLLNRIGEVDLLRVTVSISEPKFDSWLNVLGRVSKVYAKTCEYRKLPKDRRSTDGTYFTAPSEYVIYEDSLLMLLHETNVGSLKGLVSALLETIEPVIVQDYEALLEDADVSYLERSTGYMQDELMEVVKAIVECLTNLGDAVD